MRPCQCVYLRSVAYTIRHALSKGLFSERGHRISSRLTSSAPENTVLTGSLLAFVQVRPGAGPVMGQDSHDFVTRDRELVSRLGGHGHG
jgi:hypothetical protein